MNRCSNCGVSWSGIEGVHECSEGVLDLIRDERKRQGEGMIDLDELERLEKDAYPAPWDALDSLDGALPVLTTTPGMGVYFDIAKGINAAAFTDFKFIVALRNAFPALLRELRASRRLREEIRVTVSVDPPFDDFHEALEAYDDAVEGR